MARELNRIRRRYFTGKIVTRVIEDGEFLRVLSEVCFSCLRPP